MRQPAGMGLAAIMLFFLAICAGCGSGNNPNAAIAQANKTNLQRLSNLYVKYQMTNRFKGPKDEVEFRKFISSANNSETLALMGVDPNEIDELFICESDGEPFAIRYNVPSGTRGSTEPVVFQKTGSDGMRMVGFLNMVQRKVNDEEYERLFNAKPAMPTNSRSNPRSGESRSGS